ncbi:MAG: RagB/SusD family nutrient uptake outer membrane protein [Bacteroidota bacterium]
MKKIPQIILLGLLGWHLSCSNLLDKQPLDQLTTDNFYKTEADADRAVLAAYTPMMDVEWNGKSWMLTEIPSDNTQPGGNDPDFTPIDNFTVVADNVPVANFWAFRYRQITLANVVIEKVEQMELENAKKDQFIGEAKFLRAIAYFDLVRIFGGVPLITQAPSFDQDLLFPRAKASEIYDLIKSDLSFAADALPTVRTGLNLGRATKGAALALSSKVHLTLREYLQSRDQAKAVMDLGVYRLMDDYADNFELETSDNNMESIFQIQFAGCGPFGTGNALQAFFAPWGEGITKDRDGWGSQVPTGPRTSNPNTTILDAFSDSDLRKDPSIMTPKVFYPTINAADGGYTYPSTSPSATGGNIKKYVVGSGQNICFMSTPQNSHVIRYSDVLLTYAESIMEIEGGVSSNPEALAAFNQVRTRAGLEKLNQIDKETVLHERRVEFAFENHRWFDLLRSGKTIEILTLHGKNIAPHNLLFPIPLGELEVNAKLEQNPGY